MYYDLLIHVDDNDPKRLNLAFNNYANYIAAVDEEFRVVMVVNGPAAQLLKKENAEQAERGAKLMDSGLTIRVCNNALKAFKVTQQSGAYWRDDSSNKMLTRINGVAFRSTEELEEWDRQQQEARERDHRKIGREMQLFMTDDLVGKGLPMFLPNGYIVWQELENYIKEKERRLMKGWSRSEK